MYRFTSLAVLAALGVLSGCQSAATKEEHACATCKSYREKAVNPKDTSDWQRHKCECAGCTDCKNGRPCGTCKM